MPRCCRCPWWWKPAPAAPGPTRTDNTWPSAGPNAPRISALHSTGNVYFGIVTNCCDLSLLAPPCAIVLASGDLQERIMQTPIPLDGPIDLERLDEFLASDRAPAECMQLSELDGFLTGVAVGPELIPPSVWLPMIWH